MMDAKIAAEKVKFGLNNISTVELLELYTSLKGNSEFATEFASLNNYAQEHIAAFGNSTFAISLEDAVLYQAAIDAFGKNEKGELNEKSQVAQEKLDKFMAENPEAKEANSFIQEDKEAQDIEYNLFDAKESDIKNNMSFWDEKFDEKSLDSNDHAKLKEFNAILGRVKVKDDELGLDSNTYLDRLIEASMLESRYSNLGSSEVAKLKPQERNKKVFDDFINIALIKISSISLGESIRPAKGKECDPRSQEYKTYMQEYNAKVKHNIGKILSDKTDSIELSSQGVITACADTSSKANEYVKRLSEKFKNSKEVEKIQATVSKFDDGCKKVWKNRWDITKAVVESVRKNKWQVGSGLAGSAIIVGATIASASTVALPITVGYMAYSATMSWIAPVLDEASGLRKDANAAGKKISLLESLKQARKNKFKDPKYKRKAMIGTGFSVLGAGLISASSAGGIFGVVSDKATPAVQAVTARVISTISRTAGSNTSLFVERYFAKKAYKEAPADKKEELKKNLKMADFALSAGLVAGTLATYIGLSRVANANDVTEITNNAFEQAGNNPEVAESLPANDLSHIVGEFPSYNSEMGISERQYNTLLSTRTAKDLTRMYNNLSPAVMDNFPDMTKEELLYKYNRLDAFTKIVNARTGVSIDGAKRWHWDAELKDLKSMIECDDKISIEEINAAKIALSHIQENGDYRGPGDHVRTDFYLKKIDGKPCPEENINYYAHGSSKTKVIVNSAVSNSVVVNSSAVSTSVVVNDSAVVTQTTPEVVTQTTPEVVTQTTPPVAVHVENTPVDTISATPAATKYVPLTGKFNVKNTEQYLALMKSKGAVLASDNKWYVPSKDGTGVEIETTKFSDEVVKNNLTKKNGKFNVRNAKELLLGKDRR